MNYYIFKNKVRKFTEDISESKLTDKLAETNSKFLLLTEEQVNYYKDNPNALMIEVYEMKPYISQSEPEPEPEPEDKPKLKNWLNKKVINWQNKKLTFGDAMTYLSMYEFATDEINYRKLHTLIQIEVVKYIQETN